MNKEALEEKIDEEPTEAEPSDDKPEEEGKPVSCLARLRKKKGYKTAAQFARIAGIGVETYRRFERDPSKIPMKPALIIADKLHCSIDAVIGRTIDGVEPEADQGETNELQRCYDALSPISQGFVDEFMDFIKAKDEMRRKRAEAMDESRYIKAASLLSKMFLQTAEHDVDVQDSIIFGTKQEVRSQFKKFIEEKTVERRSTKIKRYVKKLKASLVEPEGKSLCQQLDIVLGKTNEEVIDQRLHDRAVAYFDDKEKPVEEVIENVMEAYDKMEDGASGNVFYGVINLP